MAFKPTTPEHSRKVFAKLIDQARQSLKNTIEYSASWLKEGTIGSHEWIVLDDNNKIQIINFKESLGNNTTLTVPANMVLLESIQKQAFCLRAGYLQKRVSFVVWLKHVRGYINIANWLSLNETQYQPQKYGFRLLNQNACKILIETYSKGGWAAVLEFEGRLCDHFCEVIGSAFDDIELSTNQISEISAYLKKNKLYISNESAEASESGLISRVYLAKVLGTHASAFQHVSIRTFLRQFEASLQGPVLIEAKTRRAKFRSHRTSTPSGADTDTVTKAALRQFLLILKSLATGNHMLPDVMPCFELNIKQYLDQSILKENSHTKKIPHSIGMYALEKSIEWIMVYGKPIVNATIELVKAFNDPDFIEKPPVHITPKRQKRFEEIIFSYHTNPYENLPAQRLVDALGITRFTSSSPRKSTNGNMTFIVALECFIAACAIVIGLTKPIRAKELSKILRNSLSYQTEGEGAFLTHPILKKRIPKAPSIRRPIPYISAIAIQLLAVLGNNLKLIYQDTSPHSNELFYFPSSKGFNRPGGRAVSDRIDVAIRSFCDIIEIPVDNYSRRWYIKVHEMRKFFILTMYRHERLFTDDALRDLAGQADKQHLMAYLSGEIPDEEFLQYTIESIEDKLIDLEIGALSEDKNQGLTALYKHALTSLNINSLKSKNSYEFERFIRSLLAHEELLISIYTIRLTTYSSEVIDTDIALKYGEAQDENFHN